MTSQSRAADPLELIETDKYVARLRAIGRTQHAREVQLIDDARGTAIADFEPSLQERRRALLMLNDHLGGFAEQLVAIRDLRLFVVQLARLLRFALTHSLENIGLVRCGIL